MKIRPHPILFVVSGFLLSVLVLFPVHDLVRYFEEMNGLAVQSGEFDSGFDFVIYQFKQTLSGNRIKGTLFYGIVGALVGVIYFYILRGYYRSQQLNENLQGKINRDISLVITSGESNNVEFKSSFRWDYHRGAVNRSLELPVMKTLAAFMNTDGGSLLIGVADDGSILGLEKDFSTLRRQNKDGFELAIMAAISSMLGTPQCAKVTILFPELEGKEICQILVSSSSKPVFCEVGKETKFFLRAGAGTRELNVRETSEYVAEHWHR